MALTDAELTHLETLARLRVPPEEREQLRADLSDILAYFEQLREVDTEGVAELVRPVATENVFREDAPLPPLPHEAVQRLATEMEDGFFKVPRTVEADG